MCSVCYRIIRTHGAYMVRNHSAELCDVLFIYLYFNDALPSLVVYLTFADCQYPIKRDLCGTVTDDQLRLNADLIT